MDVGGPLHQMKDNVFSDSVKSLNGIFAAVQSKIETLSAKAKQASSWKGNLGFVETTSSLHSIFVFAAMGGGWTSLLRHIEIIGK